MPVKDKAIVLRAGIVTVASLTAGAQRVDTRDRLENLSVQLWNFRNAKMDPATIALLRAAVPNPHYALTWAQEITRRGGAIVEDPLPGNPYHALVSGVTAQELYDIFKVNKH
jgi:hypothetical protein